MIDKIESCFPNIFHSLQFSSEYRIKSVKNRKKIGFVSKPDVNQIETDFIGPPDKVSNLRPVLRHIPNDETPIEKQLRLKRIATEEWNQHFWTNHNQNFVKVRIAIILCSLDACDSIVFRLIWLISGETGIH